MPLQTRDLWMLALGIQGDVPPHDLQPPLPDGMHLRWAFRPHKGFPWYGYYLFRRPALEKPKTTCISRMLSQYRSGSLGSDQLALGMGVLSSDEPLVFTEDFPLPTLVEVDLDDRTYVRFEPFAGEPINWAEATIGFRDITGGGPEERTCVDFRNDPRSPVANPLIRKDARFLALDSNGAPLSKGRINIINRNVGWDVGFGAEIKLPCPAQKVVLLLVHGSREPKVIAYNASGVQVDDASMTGKGPETLTLTGRGIASLRIDAPKNETILLSLCWYCKNGGGIPVRDEVCIPIEARWSGALVDSKTVCGKPGQVKKVQLSADAIDRIDFGTGEAALIDLCVATVRQSARENWEAIEDFEYPLCLPTAQPDYPCPGAPATTAQARNLALGRIHYGPSGPWGGARFTELDGRLRHLVKDGPPPGGEAMFDRFEPVAGTPAPPPEVGGSIIQKRQRPLELLLLGTLQPAIAQMLGLYWCDRTAVPGKAYDYLLVADHDHSLGGTIGNALTWVENVFDFSVVDGFIAYNKTVTPAVPLPRPTDVRVYSLPGATVAKTDGDPVIDASNNAGLTWNRRLIGSVLESDAPILYHAWRANLGQGEDPPDADDNDFDVMTKEHPIPVSRSILDPPEIPPTPAEWPDFPLHFIDRGLRDGWYAYAVSGVDIFGRHSSKSAPAKWFQWAPAPNPRPWYYTMPEADRMVEGTRIRLLDKIAPPPPPGIEAFALDPEDPAVLRDDAWETWFDSLSPAEKTSVIGLRVRWQWKLEQQRQAPDTREFRVYYHPAPLNTLRGRVTEVTPAGATETDVVTDIVNTQPADAFAGIAAGIGADSFMIVKSKAGSPLRFRVRNIGPTDNVIPGNRTRCALPLPPGHALYTDYSKPGNWQDRLLVVPYGSPVRVVGSERYYEAFLPVSGGADREGLPLTTTLREPVAAAVIGVTTADDKEHTADVRGEADRFGNESRVGGPAAVLRIRRVKPDPPPVPPDSPKLWASPADYKSNAYFTYRWLPSEDLKTFVYRALDDAVFKADQARRPRPALLATDMEFFPDPAVEPAWNALKRQQVADELNALNGLNFSDTAAVRAAYNGLSNDGMRVLAGLPGTERVFIQLNPVALDPDEPKTSAPDGLRWRTIGPDVAPGCLTGNQRAYVDALDGRASNRYFYRCAYVDETQNLGAMGLSSPPVYLPDVTPPTAPRIAGLRAGDRQITIEWASNREPDLAEYRVYRTDSAKASRDIRLMTLVHTVEVAEGDPAARPRTLSWTDGSLPGLRDFWYRVVAVDRVDPDPKGGGGNISAPSPAMRGRAYDRTPPDPPEITTLEWVRVDDAGTVHPWTDAVPPEERWESAVQIAWSPAGDGVRLLLQVKAESDTGFFPASPWLPPHTTTFLHRMNRTFEEHEYRLKVVSTAGNANVVFNPSLLGVPS